MSASTTERCPEGLPGGMGYERCIREIGHDGFHITAANEAWPVRAEVSCEMDPNEVEDILRKRGISGPERVCPMCGFRPGEHSWRNQEDQPTEDETGALLAEAKVFSHVTGADERTEITAVFREESWREFKARVARLEARAAELRSALRLAYPYMKDCLAAEEAEACKDIIEADIRAVSAVLQKERP